MPPFATTIWKTLGVPEIDRECEIVENRRCRLSKLTVSVPPRVPWTADSREIGGRAVESDCQPAAGRLGLDLGAELTALNHVVGGSNHDRSLRGRPVRGQHREQVLQLRTADTGHQVVARPGRVTVVVRGDVVEVGGVAFAVV